MVRVRFAPSPTGIMHLGNIRSALLNFLFARQKNGVFILRIEDTDSQRNFDPGGKQILADLKWLNIDYDEGPEKGGAYGPYFQSQRTSIYQEKLNELHKKNYVYRCFCTVEELEKKRKRQISLKQPPRYDRKCLALLEKEVNENINLKKPYIWRMKINHEENISVDDMARGIIKFDLHHFSDFPLTRTDGSFTFIFANCIDDILMRITHVFRGEDHLTNTVDQLIIYCALEAEFPRFWHQPFMVNNEGKKLSKRDFGFSLADLQKTGFLPEAINNYLAIVGVTFEKEIMTLGELVKAFNFDQMHHAGHIKYDVEKLRWVNHKWIEKLSANELVSRLMPYIERAYPDYQFSNNQCELLINAVKNDVHTLDEIVQEISFYIEKPKIKKEDLFAHADEKIILTILQMIQKNLNIISNSLEFIQAIKNQATEKKIPFSICGAIIRLILTGKAQGQSLKTILDLLGKDESCNRISEALTIFQMNL